MADVSKASTTSLAKDVKRRGKPRAKLACKNCRRRKVRCDVYPRGSPCTNCRLDSIDCAICEKKSRRVGGSRPPQPGATSAQEVDSLPSPSVVLTSVDISDRTLGHGKPGGLPSVLVSTHLGGHDEEITDPMTGIDDLRSSFLNDKTQEIMPEVMQNGHSISCDPEQLPSYLSCDLSGASTDDIAYLKAKKCFTIPAKHVVDDLLGCYFEYVHPHLPCLDEEDFWNKYATPPSQVLYRGNGVEDRNGISLLLFQAVLLAAITLAPLGVLSKAGYNSRRVAQRETFQKARTLYSLDTEPEQMVLLQSLLLMSYYRGNAGDDKDSWHWSGLAVSLAEALDLQRNPRSGLSKRQRTLRKRTWWSCVVRDRLVALHEQRLPRISLRACQIPMLTLADYNVGLRSPLSSMTPGEELGQRTALSMFSIHLARLLVCNGPNSLSTTAELGGFSSAPEEIWQQPRQGLHCNDCTKSDMHGLESWTANLPEILQHQLQSAGDDALLPAILVHRNMLQLYYQKILRSKVISRLMDDMNGPLSRRYSDLLCDSLRVTDHLYSDLESRDLIHCIPYECHETHVPGVSHMGTAKVDALSHNDANLQLPELTATKTDPGLRNDTDSNGYVMADFDTLQSASAEGPNLGAVEHFLKGTRISVRSVDELPPDFPDLSTDGTSPETLDITVSTPSAVFDYVC